MNNPLILTLRMDEISQSFFNGKRKAHFPPEKNFLEAHLMVFHHLPFDEETISFLKGFRFPAFIAEVTGLMKLGRGVAYRVECAEIIQLHRLLVKHFLPLLNVQDRQGYRPHVTIQNKVSPESARLLYEELNSGFEAFSIGINAIQVFSYLGGPWHHEFDVDLI
ncbi:2'-5' RNA ligase family protein [uncultured Pedobacter sp.]|uniref:2'-5' RNA ligase family protein n=1 Tax=uncultured Pedobacter sp. TaxID=246139 RepID=UPI0025CD1FF2|nr:2'-5' RNA ligase family protein [uncultured Pedobacter sp.]